MPIKKQIACSGQCNVSALGYHYYDCPLSPLFTPPQPIAEDWEKEAVRLASLVGTDAQNPKKNLISFISSLLLSREKEAYEEGWRDAEKIGIEQVKIERREVLKNIDK